MVFTRWAAALSGILLPVWSAGILLALLLGARLPAGRVVAFTSNPVRTTDIYVMDLDRGMFHYFITHNHSDEIPVWSPESRWIIYHPRSPRPGGLR